MIAIIDYGAGNLSSVAKAVAFLGYQSQVTSNPEDVLRAEVVILPGVGAAGDAIQRLHALGLAGTVWQVIAQRRPFLGICLGLQVLFTFSEESGGQECLNVIPGRVKRLPCQLKVPHMGWNRVRQRISHTLFTGIPDGAYFYFVHSYYGEPASKLMIAGETDYGTSFCSVVIRGNLVATQFHPEKSGVMGLRLLQNFLQSATGC